MLDDGGTYLAGVVGHQFDDLYLPLDLERWLLIRDYSLAVTFAYYLEAHETCT
jgi:hypothetical protein